MGYANLAHVENLDAVVRRLAPDDYEVLVPPDLAPDARLRGGGVRQAAQIHQLPLVGDLGQGGAVGLGDSHELAPLGARPPPRRGPLTRLAAQVGVADEVVKVDVAAAERVERIAGDDGGRAVAAADDVGSAADGLAGPFPGVVFAGFHMSGPRLLVLFRLALTYVILFPFRPLLRWIENEPSSWPSAAHESLPCRTAPRRHRQV